MGGGHSSCHGDITATHNGRTIAFTGGWHDASDVSQQTVQSAEVVQALLELAVEVREDALLHRRLVEEARWGLDFFLRMRFGDGYRAFSAGMSRWSNGMIGDFDDEVAREHLFLQALQAACTAQPEHPRRAAWETGMERYGRYLKAMHACSAPYGMLPAEVHAFDEVDDVQTFPLLHLYTTYEAEKEHYRAQLKSGTPVGPGHCVRHFPVWFSFRGNTAVLLSAGKAAAIVGRHFGDQALMDIARDQLYWVAGKNPFAQSLIYGEGSNYAQQYAAFCCLEFAAVV